MQSSATPPDLAPDSMNAEPTPRLYNKRPDTKTATIYASDSDKKKIPNERIQKELPDLLSCVRKTNENFRHNYDTFNIFRKFVFDTTITSSEKNANDAVDRPNIEANVITAYLSRLCGEFAKQEPDIETEKDEGADIPAIIPQIVEGHIRHIFEEAKKTNTQYHSYRDQISGGFCNFEVYTDYANSMSFEQVIRFCKSKFPTMCGYDPLATEPHKGDGQYCFKIYPKTKNEFKAEWGDYVDIEDIKFAAADGLEGFNWSFNNNVDDIILVCSMFKRKKKRVKIFKLANGQTLTEPQYKDFLKEFEEGGKVEVPPAVLDKRWTTIEVICRYIFCEKKILEYTETDFNHLPLPFIDGDSIDLYDNSKGSIKQITRPYAINAKGAQQLKNLGMQCLANYLEGLTQHKYIIKKEAIPEEDSYLKALTNLQQANTIVVNAYMDNDPDKPIPMPIEPVIQQAAPPEITAAIQLADQIIQNELGSYDAQLGITDQQLSGIAFIEAATQSNAAAMPYIVNYMSALNQVANIIVDLMPKYYRTPMTVPVIDKEGKRSFVRINDKKDPNSVDFNYDSNALRVKVKAGVNFQIQKSRALNQIIAMCNASKGFAAFMESKGLKVLLDNFDVRGGDMLKELADEYLKEVQQRAQMQQQAQQQMMQNNPQVMDQHTKAFNAQANAALKEQELVIKQKELKQKEQAVQANLQATMARSHAEQVRALTQLRMAHMDMQHRHGKDVVEMAHRIHGNEGKEQKATKNE